MAKKNTDPGLEYLNKINFKRLRNGKAFFHKLESMYGTKEATRITDKMGKLGGKFQELYELKNSSVELATVFSEAFDGEIHRSVCNYIYENKSYFGSTILEIGCDIGYVTGFLALLFPESKITAVDVNQKAIRIAEARMKELGVSNVEFICTDATTLHGNYDTVLSVRVMQENWDWNKKPFEGDDLHKQCYEYKSLVSGYASAIQSLCNKEGYCLSIERTSVTPLFCGWLLALNACEAVLIDDTYRELQCQEVDIISTFEAGVFAFNRDKKPEQELFNLCRNRYSTDILSRTYMSEWEAMVAFEANAGQRILDVVLIDPDNVKVARYALYTAKNDNNQMLYLELANGSISLLHQTIEEKDMVIDEIWSVIRQHQIYGYSYLEEQ